MTKNRSTARPAPGPALQATATAIALLGAFGPAQAGRPFATEDAGVLDRGACEWESVATRTRGPGEPSERDLSTQLGCGLGFKTQGALAIARSRAGDNRSDAWALGLKTGLPGFGAADDDGEGKTSFALAYGADAVKEAGQRTHHGHAMFVNLVATRPLGAHWTGHANLGWNQDRAGKRQDSTTWALAAEWAWNERFDVGGEVYGDDRGSRWLGAGARWTLSPAWSLNASYAASTASPRAKLASVGVTFGF